MAKGISKFFQGPGIIYGPTYIWSTTRTLLQATVKNGKATWILTAKTLIKGLASWGAQNTAPHMDAGRVQASGEGTVSGELAGGIGSATRQSVYSNYNAGRCLDLWSPARVVRTERTDQPVGSETLDRESHR
jgi:hypothetical protein